MELLGGAGNWYKGNLHMHTTVSDGTLSPEEAVARYRAAGYDFVALTDHRTVNPPWEDEDFLILSGAEYDTGDPVGDMPLFHILGIGMMDTPDLYYSHSRYARSAWPSAQEIISAIRHVGGCERARGTVCARNGGFHSKTSNRAQRMFRNRILDRTFDRKRLSFR